MNTADRMREIAFRARKEEIKASAGVIDECLALVLSEVRGAAERGRKTADVMVPSTVPARNKEAVVGAVEKVLKEQGFSIGHRDSGYSWWISW